MKYLECVGCELKDSDYCKYCRIEFEEVYVNWTTLLGQAFAVIMGILLLIVIWRAIW